MNHDKPIWFNDQQQWQPEEDNLLVMFSPPEGTIKWRDIAHALQTEIGYRIYDPKHIAQRYRRILMAKNQSWTEEEDAKLLWLHQQFGRKMAFIGKKLNRTDHEVRARLLKHGYK